MLKDITIGQYFPGDSLIHRLDARTKIVMTLIFVIALFIPKNLAGIAAGMLFATAGYILSEVPVGMAAKSIKPIIPIIAFTAVLNILFTDGDAVFSFWLVTVTKQGIMMAVIMIARIVCLIAGSSLLTYTTSPIALTDAIEYLFSPLKAFKFPAHELAMMMTIALRFIPTLIEETDKIMSAQKARGADLESGGVIDRARALVPILVPLFVSSFRRADELALAMECRCYHGGEGRTRLRQPRFETADAAAFAVGLGFFALMLMLAKIFPAAY